jgi:hypothetical protein
MTYSELFNVIYSARLGLPEPRSRDLRRALNWLVTMSEYDYSDWLAYRDARLPRYAAA